MQQKVDLNFMVCAFLSMSSFRSVSSAYVGDTSTAFISMRCWYWNVLVTMYCLEICTAVMTSLLHRT